MNFYFCSLILKIGKKVMEQQLSGQMSGEEIFTGKAVAPQIQYLEERSHLQNAVTQNNIKMNLFLNEKPAIQKTKTSRWFNLPEPVVLPGFSKSSFYV